MTAQELGSTMTYHPSDLPGLTQQEENGTCNYIEACENDNEPLIFKRRFQNQNNSKTTKNPSGQEDKAEAGGEGVWWSSYIDTRDVRSAFNVQRLEGARELHAENSQPFKVPLADWQSVPKQMSSGDEELIDETKCEMSEPGNEGSSYDMRCTGCVLSFEEVNSRTFATFQSSCTHSCDMHKVLKEATERYRTHHSSLFVRQEHTHSTSELTNPSAEKVRAAVAQNYQKNWRALFGKDVCLTPMNKKTQAKSFQSPQHWKKHKGIRLTPLHRGMKMKGPAFKKRSGSGMIPFKRSHPSEAQEEEGLHL